MPLLTLKVSAHCVGHIRRVMTYVLEQGVAECAALPHDLEHDRACACGLASNGNPLRITSKQATHRSAIVWTQLKVFQHLLDILLHPLQRKVLVQQARIDLPMLVDLIRRQEAEGSKTILYRDGDHLIAIRCDQA